MAGDWIKIEKATPRKPEVLAIAESLGIEPDEAFGLCFRFWAWCDDHLAEGNAASVTKTSLDALLNRSGFSDALLKAGWLQARTGSLVIPNFDRHLSQTAKKRALTSQRVAAHKAQKGNAPNVTNALPREEKRRDIIESEIAGDNAPPLCSIIQARSAATESRLSEEEADHWWHTRNKAGWTCGTQGGGTRKITSWRSDMATSANWVRESLSKSKQGPKASPPRNNDPTDIP